MDFLINTNLNNGYPILSMGDLISVPETKSIYFITMIEDCYLAFNPNTGNNYYGSFNSLKDLTKAIMKDVASGEVLLYQQSEFQLRLELKCDRP
jgi:hypothetical protein